MLFQRTLLLVAKVQKNPQMPKLSLDYLRLFTYFVHLPTKYKCRSQYHSPLSVTCGLHTLCPEWDIFITLT